MKRFFTPLFLFAVLTCAAYSLGKYTSIATAQSLANPLGAVGPVLAFFDRGNQEDINSRVLQTNNYSGAVEVINSIFDNPAYNPSPGQNVTLRIVDIRPNTTTQQMADYAIRLASCNCFPSGTIVTVGNELNNLTSEFPIQGATRNDPVVLRNAAQQYGELYVAFARALKSAPGGSNFRVAPAPPDLYNGDWDPAPWVEGFVSYLNANGGCAVTDTLVANVYDIPSRVPNTNLNSYRYLEGRICGLSVSRFNEWGPNPQFSVAQHIEFLNSTPLPSGISAATTLIPDNCGGNDGRATNSWLFYVNGRVYRADGSEIDPATCSTSAAPGEPFDVEPIVPCNQTYTDVGANQGREYHSLRPYPASPCDQRPVVTPALCADDLVARVEYTFQNCNPGNGGGLCTYNVTTDNIEITLGIQNAELPIVGNTEDVPNSVRSDNTIGHTTRMNEYLSWYLNGITSRAEEEDELTVQQGRVPPLSQSQIEDRINEVINLSGPLKKLLPYALQFNEDCRPTLQDPFACVGRRFSVEGYREQQKLEAGNTRHNQIVLCTNQLDFWPRACYRTDNEVRRRMVGESTLDARLLGQHNRLFSFIPFSSTEDRVGTLSADRRGYVVEGGEGTEDGGTGVDPQSIVFTPNPTLETTNGLNIPFRRLYFAHVQEVDELGDILQGTFVPLGEERAPTMVQPGIDQQRLSPFCEPIEEPISNPGDNLYGALQRDGGEPVQGTLSFSASFNCEFPDPVPNQQCINDCVFNNPSSPDPAYPDGLSYCLARQCAPVAVSECTRTVLIPIQVQVSTPLADNLWSRFVFGPTSIFRRMFPRIGEGAPIEEILDIPGESNISYSASGGSTQGTASNISVRPIAGNPYEGNSNTGSIYFPHLGSLHEYFLNGIQCALRPRGLCGNEEFASDLPPGGASQPGTCRIDGSAIMSQELRNIIANAARWANIPVELLITVVRGEGCGGGGRTGGICQYTDEQVLQFSAPGAIDPRNCPATGSKGPLQMYEDSVNWTPWMNAVNMATGENRTPEICNIQDAIYAAAYRLSAGFDGCPNAGHSVSSVPLSSWTIDQIRNTLTAWGQGCSVPQCSGVAGGFYCSQYDLWSSQITTDCN